jgi:UDP-N-acetylmuramate dehydrogenase
MNENSIGLALREACGVVRDNVPLAKMSHVRIGGPARFLVEPRTEAEVAAVVAVCRQEGVEPYVLGGGSNLLIGDDGVASVVIHLGALNRVVRDGSQLAAGAGVSVPTLLRNARELGLAGLEVLTGIPAHVGGVVAMNAGTREGETFDCLQSVTVVERDGTIRQLDRTECHPEYRNGNLGDRIVVQAAFMLEDDDPKAIYSRFESYLKYRNTTQPVAERSLGCVFKNPGGDSAGRLIERAGCKLMRRGAIVVSAKHANYFVNEGDGTCADFVALMEAVRERVDREFRVRLVPEVRRWNVPGDW